MNVAEEIAWIHAEVLQQVDAALEHFVMMECADKPLLEFSKVTVTGIIGRVDVMHALNMHAHLVRTSAIPASDADRINALCHYFQDTIALELAKRYA